jgi:hypothetical protein
MVISSIERRKGILSCPDSLQSLSKTRQSILNGTISSDIKVAPISSNSAPPAPHQQLAIIDAHETSFKNNVHNRVSPKCNTTERPSAATLLHRLHFMCQTKPLYTEPAVILGAKSKQNDDIVHAALRTPTKRHGNQEGGENITEEVQRYSHNFEMKGSPQSRSLTIKNQNKRKREEVRTSFHTYLHIM